MRVPDDQAIPRIHGRPTRSSWSRRGPSLLSDGEELGHRGRCVRHHFAVRIVPAKLADDESVEDDGCRLRLDDLGLGRRVRRLPGDRPCPATKSDKLPSEMKTPTEA